MTEDNSGRKLKVLIVEDELTISLAFAEYFRRKGIEVTSTESSGEGAVESARQNRPHFVIMDIYLDGNIDGIEAAEQILLHDESIRFCFISAYCSSDFSDRLERFSNYSFFNKPLLFKTLDKIVADFLSSENPF